MNSQDFLSEALEKHSNLTPDKVFLNDGEKTLTYSQALKLVRQSTSMIVDDPNSIEGVIELVRSRSIPVLEKYNASQKSPVVHDKQVKQILEKHPGELLKTSGSTGSPKLVFVTFEAQHVTANSINKNILKDKEADELILLPLRHSSGLGRLRAAVLRGASIRIASLPLSPKKISNAIKDSSNSVLALTPTTWRFLLSTFGETIWDRLSDIRSIEFGSAPLSKGEIDQLVSNMDEKTDLLMHYGLTEASRSFLRDLRYDNNPLSLGKPLPHVTAGISGEDSPTGELVISGPHVAKFILDGENFLSTDSGDIEIKTGDLATESQDGYLLQGRLKEEINSGGIKVSPSQLESIISDLGMPGEIAVVGAPHQFLGEQVVLIVESKYVNKFHDIQEKLQLMLPNGHTPKLVISLDEFPVLPNAKTDRMKLKEIAAGYDPQ